MDVGCSVFLIKSLRMSIERLVFSSTSGENGLRSRYYVHIAAAIHLTIGCEGLGPQSDTNFKAGGNYFGRGRGMGPMRPKAYRVCVGPMYRVLVEKRL